MTDNDVEMIDIRGAAALVRCHPETVRRWVWSGRLAARRQGSRLFVARTDVEAIVTSRGGGAQASLAEWADRARATRETSTIKAGSSAAGLVIEDRAERSHLNETLAGR